MNDDQRIQELQRESREPKQLTTAASVAREIEVMRLLALPGLEADDRPMEVRRASP